jgi:exonuclease SbcD
MLDEANPDLPVVLTAHASVQGAVYGGERTVMLGSDLLLPGSLVRDPRLDYVALGHIHKSQNLNENAHPPVIYPGSIERVDFGEAADDKFFVLAHVEHGHTEVEWRKLKGIRPFIDRSLRLKNQEDVTGQLQKCLPQVSKLEGAIVRLVLEYPREWETLIDEIALRQYTSGAFEFHLIRRPMVEARARLAQDETVGSLTPLELLDRYWRASHIEPSERDDLQKLATEIIEEPENLS